LSVCEEERADRIEGGEASGRLEPAASARHDVESGRFVSVAMAVEHPREPSLLIIDDDRDSLDVLEFELRSYGYDVRKARSGSEGLAIAAEFRPAIVLCDVGMPGMDGYEVARRLRELRIEPMKLVALTGYGSDEDRERAHEAGFDVHVLKGTARFLDDLGKAIPRLAPKRGASD
jgi:CheY-like chemotaxis protein